MLLIEQDSHNTFKIRENTWDERALKIAVTEVFDLKYNSPSFLKRIDEENTKLGSRLCCIRHPADDISAKRDLMALGFYAAENSLECSATFAKLKCKSYFKFELAKASDLPALQQIGASDFRFGRFHEDPSIQPDLAVVRYKNWIQDLVNDSKCWVARTEDGSVIGFFSYDKAEPKERITLTLAGIASSHQGIGLFFFSSLLDYLKPHGKTVSALISAANLDVINIYSTLGFTFRRSLIGYHKHYSP